MHLLSKSVFTIYFAVDGNWTGWSEWNSCSDTCGGGLTLRYRNCSNPEPQFGGIDCIGNGTENDSCNTHYCPGYKYNSIKNNIMIILLPCFRNLNCPEQASVIFFILQHFYLLGSNTVVTVRIVKCLEDIHRRKSSEVEGLMKVIT